MPQALSSKDKQESGRGSVETGTASEGWPPRSERKGKIHHVQQKQKSSLNCSRGMSRTKRNTLEVGCQAWV